MALCMLREQFSVNACLLDCLEEEGRQDHGDNQGQRDLQGRCAQANQHIGDNGVHLQAEQEVFADEVLAIEQQGISQVARQRTYKVQRSLFSIVTALVRDQAGKEADEELRVLTEKARTKQAELNEQGMGSEVLREEPFTIARDSLGFKVYLMKWNKGRKDCTVEIEEI